MKKLSAASILAVVSALLLGSTVAYAAFHWCPDDPVLSIDGKRVSVLIELAVEEGQDPAGVVTGPVQVKVYVPEDAKVKIKEGSGFGHGEEIEIVRKRNLKNEVEVRVKVPTHGSFPVKVTVTAHKDSDVKEGQSNQWVECKVKL
jgi:hypothetical protein